MSFDDMRQRLEDAYSKNLSRARIRALVEDGHWMIGDQPNTTRTIPVLRGTTGVGKTSCVQAFARDHDFELAKLDCSCMPPSALVAAFESACRRIADTSINGSVILIDNADSLDDEWKEILLQYCESTLDTDLTAHSDQVAGRMEKLHMHIESIPATVFVVGEARTP